MKRLLEFFRYVFGFPRLCDAPPDVRERGRRHTLPAVAGVSGRREPQPKEREVKDD